jgi:hypothetical protein
LRNEPNTSSNSDGSRNFNIWKGHANPLVSHRDIKKNILFCLEGRETGVSCSQAASYGGYAGRNCERWTPFLEGTFVCSSVIKRLLLSCSFFQSCVYLFHFPKIMSYS